jgi:hypothetical protein
MSWFGAPQKLDYWRAAKDSGFGQLALFMPTRPCDGSLRLLDEYAAQRAKYRGEVSS